jgi:general secretion pathway protein G
MRMQFLSLEAQSAILTPLHGSRAKLVLFCEVPLMSSLRSQIGLTIIVSAALLAQPSDQTRAKEDALKHSLFTLREVVHNYTRDQHKAPKALQDLITKEYLTNVPVDPITNSTSTWRVVMEDPSKSADPSEPGISDVHSGSDGISSDGTRYADW